MDLSYPESDEIDQELAKYLYTNCAILIIEELPVNSEFGIDLITFKTGERFKGVKMIPPGVHYFYTSAVAKDGQHYGPRVGFYHNFKPKEVHVKRWSSAEEDFDDAFRPNEDYLVRYSSNLADLDRYLGAYRYSTYKTYLNLTNKISLDILEHLVPANHKIRSVPYLVRAPNANPSETPPPSNVNKRRTLRTESEPTEESLMPDLQPDAGTLIKFTSIPEKHSQVNSTMSPDLITLFYLDSTARMGHVFGGETGRQRMLAEFQFSFVTLIMGHVYACFEQWRKILVMICSADSALNRHQDFFIEFTRILRSQLEHVPEDLFIDITDTNNLVRHQLDIFFQNCLHIQDLDDVLRIETDNLRTLLEEKYGWQFKLDLDDDLPTIA